MTARASGSLPETFSLGRSELSVWLASLVGQWQLRSIIKDGLPPTLHSPFLFLLNCRLNAADYEVVRRIEALRSEMASREGDFIGVFSDSPQAKTKLRSLTQVAFVSSVLPKWGTFLHLCANASGAKTILEFGTSAGISGCYLASAENCERFRRSHAAEDIRSLQGHGCGPVQGQTTH